MSHLSFNEIIELEEFAEFKQTCALFDVVNENYLEEARVPRDQRMANAAARAGSAPPPPRDATAPVEATPPVPAAPPAPANPAAPPSTAAKPPAAAPPAVDDEAFKSYLDAGKFSAAAKPPAEPKPEPEPEQPPPTPAEAEASEKEATLAGLGKERDALDVTTAQARGYTDARTEFGVDTYNKAKQEQGDSEVESRKRHIEYIQQTRPQGFWNKILHPIKDQRASSGIRTTKRAIKSIQKGVNKDETDSFNFEKRQGLIAATSEKGHNFLDDQSRVAQVFANIKNPPSAGAAPGPNQDPATGTPKGRMRAKRKAGVAGRRNDSEDGDQPPEATSQDNLDDENHSDYQDANRGVTDNFAPDGTGGGGPRNIKHISANELATGKGRRRSIMSKSATVLKNFLSALNPLGIFQHIHANKPS